jgi:PD-(D/E)XK nuclease superfamily
VEGRLLGRSPLAASIKEEVYLGRARIPQHAGSESDRLFARPAEFAGIPAGISGRACWRDWQRYEITPHDGFVGRVHPRLQKVFDGAMSATSLKLLLRDPIRFVWCYALGWRQPDEADEPLTVDALAFGTLVHEALRNAVDTLEGAGGLAAAGAAAVEDAIRYALDEITTAWELEQPVPPAVIWRNTLARERAFVDSAALSARPAPRAEELDRDPVRNTARW